jgi:signal peptidase I
VKRRFLARAAWILGAAVVVLLLLKTFVGDVYHVVSSSMEPAIWGVEGDGEWVFVRFDRSAPERNELVVVRRAEDDAPIVKRVLGKPGESIKIAQGDVLIDRQRRRPSEERAPEIVVFDDRWHRLEERFEFGPAQATVWKRGGTEWTLDAREHEAQDDAALLRFIGPLNDDYLGPEHELVAGSVQANDARIACEVRFDDATGEVRFGLKEMGDTFEAVLSRVDATTAKIVVLARRDGTEWKELKTARFPLLVGSWTPFSFENKDDALKVTFPGPGSPLVHVYKENEPDPAAEIAGRTTTGSRAYFGGAGGRISFRSVRLARDLYYTDRGRIGVESEIQLGDGEYFLLGDNSSQSRDSREWGPVKQSDIVGRAVRVVWPPSRWRRIGDPGD